MNDRVECKHVIFCRHIGYRLGDATCAELPETCEIKRDLVEVDLRTMPDNELDDLCAASCKDPFRDMLIKQPGVLQNKQAHFTGRLAASEVISERLSCMYVCILSLYGVAVKWSRRKQVF